MLKAEDLFDLGATAHADLFAGSEPAWDALRRLADYIAATVRPGLHNRCDGIAWIGDQVAIGEGTEVEDGARIEGPAIIGRNCRIRHNAYIRQNVLVGDDCLIGNACELKQAILFNGCEVPHFNYVGDSILGTQAHLGAGAKISNLKIVPGNVQVLWQGNRIDTGLRKLGALLGDRAEVGCNAVLNPGSILGRNSLVYPNVNWRGTLDHGHLAKNRAAIDVQPRRP